MIFLDKSWQGCGFTQDLCGARLCLVHTVDHEVDHHLLVTQLEYSCIQDSAQDLCFSGFSEMEDNSLSRDGAILYFSAHGRCRLKVVNDWH